ncbi:citrinin biosynthesis cluster MFS transporter mrr1 [Apiospora rasikravindrae]|uniref:Citrinin biosynthesis cluster MFS transporter mrr1 n=1 Tax=Apiospora rasikravindrae TaxID=990691 RepID=A0ABR1RR07_9PEZI
MDRQTLRGSSSALEMQAIRHTPGSSTKAPTEEDLMQPHSGPKDDDGSVMQGEQIPAQDVNLVDWDGPDDPTNPQNWSWKRKLVTTVVLALCTFSVSFGSSILASAIAVLSTEFHVSSTVTTLNVTLYVLGFAAGPWVWGPASEYIGRYWPLVIGYVGFMCFTVGVASAQNLYTIMICRFMQGAWGVATVTVTPGVFVDLWDIRTRALATIAWAATIVIGPTMGPIIGSFTVKNESLGWRWTMWFTLIISAFFFILVLICFEETWGPIILQKKAKRLRYETKNWALHSKRDEAPVDSRALLWKYGLKPWQMLMYEPILVAICLYNSLIYGVIYLSFEVGNPFQGFGTVRQWEDGVSSLPFLSLLVGYLGAAVIQTFIHLQIIDKKLAKGIRPSPEDQLPTMIVGSFLLTIGLFWFAWTSSPNITWVPQVIAGPFIGCGINMVFVPCLNYLIECYLVDANSALAANTIIRSAVAAGFPLFATPMYANLGVAWATSLLGFLCLAFIPAPLVFYFYGKKIRGWSKFAFAFN